MTTAPDVPDGQRTHAPTAIERALDRHSWTVFGIFALVCAASLIVRARAKPFWHDEIYTILHAGLPTIGDMWKASLDGFDLGPPLNTWVTRGVHGVAGVGHISTRVPPMAGYLVMTAVVFHLVRSRANTVTALAAALLPGFTAAYRYSYEARGYGLMVGLFALSLYSWTEAARRRQRMWHLALLSVTLAAAVWNHYYGILTFVPIAGGEAVRTFRRRRIDTGILTAFIAACLMILPLYPLAAAARTQSASFWSPAALRDVKGVYAYVFAPVLEYPFIVAAIAIAAVAILARVGKVERSRTIPAHEVAAGLLALVIPLTGVILGLVATGVFVPRYAMSAAVGFAFTIPLLVWQRQSRWGLAELALTSFLLVNFWLSIGPSLMSVPEFRDPFLTRPLLQSAVTTGPELVSASSLQFLQYWYYTPKPLKGRLRYLADVANAKRFTSSDTIDRGYLTLRRWTPVSVESYQSYIAGHREFRVHEAGSGWILKKLDESGAVRTELGNAPGERLFLVRLPPGAGH